MADVKIYDSQGNPVGEGRGRADERIKDFFFDGVQLTVDSTGRETEIVCFFRARDSEASRSEQYYAVFESSHRNVGRFGTVVTERIEDDLGLILETSTEDTTIFELLRSGERPSPPLEDAKIDVLIDLLDDAGGQSLPTDHVAKIGTGSYRDAFGLCRELITRRSTNARYAIADNADSSRLQHFDVVVEHGSYAGVELFDETEEAIQKVRKRRRGRRQPTAGAPFEPTNSSSGMSFTLVGGAALLILGMTVFGTYGLCSVGINVPIAGDLLGTSCSQLMLNVQEANVQGDTLQIEANLTRNGQNVSMNATMDINVVFEPDQSLEGAESMETHRIEKKDVAIRGNETVILVDRNGIPEDVGNYTVSLDILNLSRLTTESGTPTPSEGAQSSSPTGTPTQSGTPTSNSQSAIQLNRGHWGSTYA